MTTPIALLCPVAETLSPDVFQYTMAAVSRAYKEGYPVEQVGVTKRTLVHSARNILAKGFLETSCEWAFWMDADMVLPPEVIPHLMQVAAEKNAKFVTGIYYQRVGRHNPVLWKKNPKGLDGKEIFDYGKKDELESYLHHFIIPQKGAVKPFRADVCGFGCVLTHREMFEKIPHPWFRMVTEKCSEDFWFCVEAKKAGYELWATPKLRIGHIGNPEIVYQEHFNYEGTELKQVQL